jgi:AcrR family transcriptional regulator
MAARATTRKTAGERRESILEAALAEFAARGLHGTSTEEIARRAGISQPYLFRLFGTKKELFIASVERCLRETRETFEAAAAGHRGEQALKAMGEAYLELLDDRSKLLAQMQSYAACDDPDVRAVVRRGFGDLFEYVERASGASPARAATFFAKGMLLNVVAAMDLLHADEGWAERLIQGFREA